MAKTFSKPVSRKPAGKPSQKTTVRHSGQQSVATRYNKPPSTTNVGTRPAAPVSPRLVAGPSTPSITPTTVAGKVTAAPIPRVVAPVVNRAAALASNIAKTAANQQVHNAAVRTAMNHPTEISSGPGGGNNGGGGFNTGGGSGSGATPVTPAVTTPTTPVVSRPAPSVTSPAVPGAPTNVGTFTSRGGNMTAGRFNRQRLNRGPRSGMSITPEMLQRIAAQRIGPT